VQGGRIQGVLRDLTDVAGVDDVVLAPDDAGLPSVASSCNGAAPGLGNVGSGRAKGKVVVTMG
jgi:hypothetical protein